MAFLISIAPRRLMRGTRGLAEACALALALLASPMATAAPAPRAPSPEFQVKAGQLFHFTGFVEWPSAAFRDPEAPLVIGVLGDDPFGSVLDELVRDEKINGHPLVARRYRHVEDVTDCHILFISGSEAADFPRILAQLHGRSVLTVGDTDGFIRAGGMVRFVIESGKVRQRINVAAARAAGLTISSMLLRLATIVTPDKD
jgi:hypothetical protein